MTEKYVGAFGVIPNAILYNEDLSHGEKILYTMISSLCNKNGYCFASNAYLSKILKTSKSTIGLYLKHLEELNYISRDFEEKEGRVNDVERKIYLNYDSLFDKGGTDQSEEGYQPVGRGVPTDKEGGTDTSVGGYRPVGSIIIQDNNTNIIKQDNNTSKGELEKRRDSFRIITDKFNEAATEYDLNKIIKLSDKRKAKLKVRIDELGEDKIIEAIDKIKESSFLQGENDRHWKVDFDWLIANDTNILKVLEDKYKDEKEPEDDDPWKKVGYRFWLM